jgi:hypothetical protein
MPFPKVTARELEHLKSCAQCAATWPMFVHHFCQGKSRDVMSREWLELSEADRDTMRASLLKREVAWLHNKNKRVPSAYQLFQKQEECRHISNLPFADRVKAFACEWAQLSDAKKQELEGQSRMLKKQKQDSLRNLSKYERARLNDHRRRKARHSKTRPQRPHNAYMLYQLDRWQDEKRQQDGLKYRALMGAVAREWRDMTATQKQPYQQKAAARRAEHDKQQELAGFASKMDDTLSDCGSDNGSDSEIV